jgi:hypothetical protein
LSTARLDFAGLAVSTAARLRNLGSENAGVLILQGGGSAGLVIAKSMGSGNGGGRGAATKISLFVEWLRVAMVWVRWFELFAGLWCRFWLMDWVYGVS